MPEPTKRGRKTIRGESADERFNLRLTAEFKEKIEEQARSQKISPTEFIRRKIEGDEVSPSAEQLRQMLREELAILAQTRPGMAEIEIGEVAGGVRLFQFDAMPCGPLQESQFGATPTLLPDAIAAALGAQPSDWLVPAKGESMVETGIADGALVVMRPYAKGAKPREGDIVLASIETDDGKRFSTIKFWYSGSRGGVRLLKGNLSELRLPENLKSVFPMARYVGIIGPAPGGDGTAKGRRTSTGGRPGAKQSDWWENPESE